MKYRIPALLILVSLIVVTLFFSGCGMEEAMDRFVENAEFHTPDISDIPDGTYTGSYRSGIVSAKVMVTVESGRIAGIEIKRHFNGEGEVAENIIVDVLAAQSVEVDVISGATYSSKVILKAIEIALTDF